MSSQRSTKSRNENLQAVIQDVVARLRREYQPEKVILFGSYARGEARPDSDLDLLIIKQTPDRFIDRWVAVRRILSDPQRRIPLETIVLTPKEISKRLKIGDHFISEILKKGKILYGA